MYDINEITRKKNDHSTIFQLGILFGHQHNYCSGYSDFINGETKFLTEEVHRLIERIINKLCEISGDCWTF